MVVLPQGAPPARASLSQTWAAPFKAIHLAQVPRPFLGSWGCISFRTNLPGSGVCPAGWGELLIAPNGTYRMGVSRGRVVSRGDRLVFGGALRFMGAASLTKPGQLEFEWNDSQGYAYWVVFIRNR